MKSKKILKSRKKLSLLLISLVLAIALVMPTTLMAFGSTHPGMIGHGLAPLASLESRAGLFQPDHPTFRETLIAGDELVHQIGDE
ncbi:MAG: hypothetical protein FWC82_03495, partial [Firmicutes bacterium]|nr:hypothetical protein [Bacillota bacterium]